MKMACKETKGKCFTFFWKLENINYCLQKTGEKIESPTFIVDAIEKTKWNMRLYPRGVKNERNHIGLFLCRDTDSEGPEKVEIEYELAFIAEDSSVLVPKHIVKYAFPKDGDYGFQKFEKRENIFISERAAFLPRDTLTVRCRIWKIAGKMKEDCRCSALTRIGIQKRSFLWNVKNFISLEPDKKFTYQMRSIENDTPLVSIDLSLTDGLSSEEIIHFKLSLRDQTIRFATLRIHFIDASGNRVECNQEEIWFDDPALCKQITFLFTKKKLLEGKSLYLPNDILSLFWEWTFSKGVVSEEIQVVEYECEDPEIKISPTHIVKNDKTFLLNLLVDNVKSLYDEHFLSDVKLNTKSSMFPAHKLILSASSSVFKKMFSTDMKEKDSNRVNIDDLDDDTICRMLLYMYTTRVEDLTWESASHLYVAADKYAIFNLKDICSAYLKDNLSPSNACEVLLVSDLHTDDDLKSAVQDYILKRGKQITNSDEWKALVETNAKLAVETLCLLFK